MPRRSHVVEVASNTNSRNTIELRPIKDIADSLTVGQHIIFNVDGAMKIAYRFISGVLTKITTEEGVRRFHAQRDDGVQGKGYQGAWWFTDDSEEAKVLRVGVFPEAPSRPRELQSGDVVSHFNGEGTETLLLGYVSASGKVQALPLSGEMEQPSVLEPEEVAEITYLGHLEKIPCDRCTDGSIAMVYQPHEWACATHRRTDSENLFCVKCQLPLHPSQAYPAEEAGDLDLPPAIRTSPRSSRYICQECHRMLRRGNSSILDYSYKPKPKFIYTTKPSSNLDRLLYMGVELETELPSGRSPQARAKDLLQSYASYKGKDWFYIKHDGSLHNGMEIVTEPATLTAHSRHLPWREMLRWMREHDFGSDTYSNTGLHVHINRSFMQTPDAIKLGYFVNSHKEKVEYIARRSSHYAQFRTPVMSEDMISKNYERYSVINWQPPRTAEWRVFKGTVIHKHLMEALEFVDATTRFCKEGGLDTDKLKSASRSWGMFEEYVHQHSELYPALFTLISEGMTNARRFVSEEPSDEEDN